MKKLRKICVDNTTYLWKLGIDYDYIFPTYLLFFPEDNRNVDVHICFNNQDHPIKMYMMKSGVRAKKDAQEIIINLNEPRYIIECIKYLLSFGKVDFTKEKRHYSFDGYQIMHELGYEFF